GRRVHQAAEALTRSAQRIGQGDYARPVEAYSQDGLGELEQAMERMRARLRHSTINKDYLRSVLNSMADAVFLTSPDGVIKTANAAACKMLGFSEEELLGRGVASLLEEHARADFDLL
ncbi:HAMP linker domain protein, partial [mine drainage metagenome]